MRKGIVGCIGVATMVAVSFAGVEIGASLGYGFGAGQQLVNANTESNSTGDYLKYNEVYASGGNGLKIDVDGVYYLNDNLGIMAATGFSFLGGYKATDKSPTGTDELTMSYSYLPINIGLKLKSEMGMVTPYAYVAPGIYIAFGGGEGKPATGEKTKYTYSFAPGFGFTSGMGAAISLSDALNLKFEINPTYAFANMTQSESERAGVKHTIVYENNKTTQPTSTTDKSYQHGQPRQSFSSVALKVGVSIGF